MNVYSDETVEIELLKDQSILSAILLDPVIFSILNLKDAFFVTMEQIERHAVKKVVLQSNLALLNMPEPKYAMIMEVLISGLLGANIKKVANVYLEKSAREVARLTIARNILEEMSSEIEFRNFDDRPAAINWLEKEVTAV